MKETKTPRSAALIEQYARTDGQTQFATRCGLKLQTVNSHIIQARSIRDNHLAAYMSGMGAKARAELLAAWLQDVLPTNIQSDVFGEDLTLNETVTNWRHLLDPKLMDMLDWLADQLTTDPELRDIFVGIIKKLGYTPSASSITYRNTSDASADQLLR